MYTIHKHSINKRILAYIIGGIIIALGASLIIRAELGTGPWNSLDVGLTKSIGLTPGSWLIIVGSILVVVNAILLRAKPDLLAIPILLYLGLLVDIWLYLISFAGCSFFIRLLGLLLGMISLALGTSIYVQANFGMTSVDRFMFAISQTAGVSIKIAKTISELIALSLAFYFHGPIGLGTVLVTFGSGPLIECFLPRVKRVLNRL